MSDLRSGPVAGAGLQVQDPRCEDDHVFAFPTSIQEAELVKRNLEAFVAIFAVEKLGTIVWRVKVNREVDVDGFWSAKFIIHDGAYRYQGKVKWSKFTGHIFVTLQKAKKIRDDAPSLGFFRRLISDG